MEYIYGAMLLHSAGQEIKEDSLKKVLTAAGIKKVDEARIKALTASLEDVNIEEVISSAAAMPAAAPAAQQPAQAEEKKEEKKEEAKEEEVSEEEAAEGLGALFD